MKEGRHLTGIVAARLEDIHPNPGPRRGMTRVKTPEAKKARRERRYEKRKQKKPPPPKTKPFKKTRIVTWNLQGISMRDRNRATLRRTVDYIRKLKWDITLISETRADQEGVISLGEGTDKTVVIPSKECCIILRGTALQT